MNTFEHKSNPSDHMLMPLHLSLLLLNTLLQKTKSSFSSIVVLVTLLGSTTKNHAHTKGPFRGLNPGPPAPEAGIMPLDQMDL